MLSGMVAGGMVVIGPSAWDEGLSEILKNPNIEIATEDESEYLTIHQIPSENIKGTVGKDVEVQVFVLNEKLQPVNGVSVSFGIIEGCGSFSGGDSASDTTKDGGYAKVSVTLGNSTSCNSAFVQGPEDTYAQQVGMALIDARTSDGDAKIAKPIVVEVYPDMSELSLQMLPEIPAGGEIWGYSLSFAGCVPPVSG